MKRVLMTACLAFVCQVSAAQVMEIPITPFSNMASGYQATNPGFRAILRNAAGDFIAGGPLTIDAVISGYSDDASSGSPYGKLVLRLDIAQMSLEEPTPGVKSGFLSLCMARDQESSMQGTQCKNLSGNIHPERPFQYLDMPVQFTRKGGDIQIISYDGDTGEGGTPEQISLAVYHPAYGFAAPGKSFKDYQSPLTLDLNNDGRLSLLNVHNNRRDVRFDFDGSGKKVRTGWIVPSEGLLFWDDGTGCVKNGTQLYGEYFGSKDGKKTYSNGFEALKAQLDPLGTGKVVASKHKALKIWRNWGVDGVCRPGEVYPARQFVKVIHLAYTEDANPSLNEDNEVRAMGMFTLKDGSKGIMGDVYFKQRRSSDVKVDSKPAPRSISVSNRRPIQAQDTKAVKSYADANNFYLFVNLRDGMRVAYSASYGVGGEAGQAWGTLVADGDHFWFRQEDNPTQQLLLPPGLTFDSSASHSLWDFKQYMALVNRVAYSVANESSMTSSDVYGNPAAALVDFKGGTAGVMMSYKDALEIVYNRKVEDRSNSNLSVYYGKGVGPVALEFSEDKSPSGTFKVYLGQ